MPPPFYWSRAAILISEAYALALLLIFLNLELPFVRLMLLRIRALASKAWLPPASVALGVILVRLAMLPSYPVPEPMMHDEFSLILGAQTFALGRLTNPPHPLWPFFETFHVLHEPTYMSIYPPAQAAALAIGTLLGHPWVSVVAISALMCAAFVWMLQAWFSPGWAWCGGVLLLFKIAVVSYWTNSYWGGSLAALAGAVLLGAAGRIWSGTEIRVREALLLGASVAVLLNRRPFEGALVTVGIAAATVYWFAKNCRRPVGRQLARLALCVSAVLVPCIFAVGYYNFRVTGDPWLMPYVKGIETYGIARHDILMGAAPEPAYHNREFREFYRHFELRYFAERKARPLASLVDPILELWAFYLGPALTLLLLMLPRVWRDQRFRPVILILAGCILVNLTETWILPHYVAPEAPLLWVVLIACLQQLSRSRHKALRRMAAASVLACISGTAATIAIDLFGGNRLGSAWDRPRIAAQLRATPGKHVVIVEYLPGHSVHNEFVYNEPEIDASRIIWARDLGSDRDRQLLEYYRGRRFWLLRVGATVESFNEIVPGPLSAKK